MHVTSYDEVYEIFDSLMDKADEYYLPHSEKAMYKCIHLGVISYNTRLNLLEDEDTLKYDDETETFSMVLNSNQKSLLAHCMKLCILEDMKLEFGSMIAMTSKDQSIKDYRAQMEYRQLMIEQEQKEIYRIAFVLNEYDVE